MARLCESVIIWIMSKENVSKINKEYLFEEMPIAKAIAKLSVPTVMGCLVMIIYNLADTLFVGMLDDPIQTAAVTLGATLLLAFNAVSNLFGVGASSLMSRALGIKDYNTVRQTAAFGFYCALVMSIIYSAVVGIFNAPIMKILGATAENAEVTSQYVFWTVVCGAAPAIINVVMGNLVRAEGAALHASIGTMSGCVLNIILDPIFILPEGLNMGASGAGLATFISNCVACLYFFIYLAVKHNNTYVSIRLSDFKPTRIIAGQVFSVGIPASIQNLLNVTGMAVLNNLMAVYGSAAVAAIGIAHKTAMIPMYMSMGISQGVMPLVGYNFSSGNRKRMNDTIKGTIKVSMTIMIITIVCFYIGAGQITSMFMKTPEIVEYGTKFMRAQCLAQPFVAFDFIGVAVYQACGKGKISLVFAIFRKVVLEIPALLVLDKLFPMYGLAYAPLVSEFVLAIAAGVCLRSIMKSK